VDGAVALVFFGALLRSGVRSLQELARDYAARSLFMIVSPNPPAPAPMVVSVTLERKKLKQRMPVRLQAT
jgi:hypothetical protein